MAASKGTGQLRRRVVADLPGDSVKRLADRFEDRAFVPSNPRFEEARTIWNSAIELQPGLIIQCEKVDDVLACLQFAREQDLVTSVRGGGHGVSGHALCDGGLVIDLTRMRAITVDSKRATVRAQGGATWGDFDSATAEFGLATTGGQISTTGVGGLTLGGGLGWLMREYGATVDNVESIEVVTADARIVNASVNENPDLFWACRGGGGNFGIATSLTYRLHPVSEVLGGAIFWRASKSNDVLMLYREMIATAPRTLTLMAYFVPRLHASFIPPELIGTSTIAIAVCCTGSFDEQDQLVNRLRSFGEPIGDSLRSMPYTELQKLYDVTAPFGMKAYWRSCYLANISDELIEVIGQQVALGSSPVSNVLITHMQGALEDAGTSDTAFGFRNAAHFLEILAKWTEGPAEPHKAWADSFYDAVAPYSMGSTYVNFLDDAADNLASAYEPATYERLRALKRVYDPENLFDRNVNIIPAGGFEAERP